MSHFTRVEVELADAELLVEALQQMGHKRIEENADVRGWSGKTERADLVVRQPDGYDIGFVRARDGENFRAVADWSMGSVNQDEFIRELRQEYAAAGAIRGAKEDGWRNVERKYTEDGEIEIVATGHR